MGYTLPVFACASAIAALRYLHQDFTEDCVTVDLIKPPQKVNIPIEQIARINGQSALAITRSDPGEHLDITRNTPIWALVERKKLPQIPNSPNPQFPHTRYSSRIEIKGGEGIGIQINNEKQWAIYGYARELITQNLQPLLATDETIVITIILPEGRRLAQRTSNAAFGVVEGLSLLGTTGIVQPLTAASQLEKYQAELIAKAQEFDSLVFCLGENGVDLAPKLGINPQRIVKTANWIGSMLVTAGMHQVQSILLFGYHGKLIKLAGGIFHTHNHLADGRLEILTAYCAQAGLPKTQIQDIFACETTESALQILRHLDGQTGSSWVDLVYSAIAESIDQRSQAYIYKHIEQNVKVGSIVFDRQRKIIKKSFRSSKILEKLC
ncbi:cobalamin biosynthesis protein CbiD [Xenococcus sp. PCC 7305]|uniref:cobalt-precorrin-5B (C(1))-methyltransferase CbiD n=1 Tax=Xenococcus sp. PCC 7305 TaxID=102125 RepID=UPI0002ACCCB5|nr:cobalt-precorrin-5B (C(1))-methyltransferase CbiD [Xenococcus sp. PCC 7305]ELS01598.1 cobalamin biosynthesis protein CbiD [Xenococcus sp. PCC 7305]